MKATVAYLAVLLSANVAWASSTTPGAVGHRAKRARTIVVARVAGIDSHFATTQFGDQVILSRVTLDVEETLKGPHQPSLSMTVEGGTVDGLTLKVSDMPSLRRGDRAVVFLDSSGNDLVPTDRGEGVMRLDRTQRVTGSAISLDDIRQLVGHATR